MTTSLLCQRSRCPLRVTYRLPSTRTLSKELDLSRITILNAFDQLIAEGFLASRTGAGTYVGNEWEDRGLTDDQPPPNRRACPI